MRLHPLIAGAAVAVIIAAGVAVAAITGYLPGSKAEPDSAPVAAKPAQGKTQVAAAKPAQTKTAAACQDCGVIVEVKEVNVPAKGSGIGAVAGGVAGAVIGNEIGDGNKAGTVAGAVVGGVAGHQIERQARAHKRYDIVVRMNDGSVRNLSDETGKPVALRSGDKVRVSREGVIRPI